MAPVFYLVFLFVSCFLLLSLADADTGINSRCQPFPCGELGQITFPFSNETHQECGLLRVNCNKRGAKKIWLGKKWSFFNVRRINQDNSVSLERPDIPRNASSNQSCRSLKNLTIDTFPFISFNISFRPTTFECPGILDRIPANFRVVCTGSNYSIIHHKHSIDVIDRQALSTPLPRPPAGCSVFRPIINKTLNSVDFLNVYSRRFRLQVNVTKECYECYQREGRCHSDSKGKFYCLNARKEKEKLRSRLGLGFGMGASIILFVALSIFIKRLCKNGKCAFPNFHSSSRNTSSDSSSKSDLEAASKYFTIPILSYCELAEATNNFHQGRKLGAGGFGTVYYGKLRDGREVAVKRLYENSYRRFEQFMNEIEILTLLHHKNLVLLYGCTSRRSQGLLLVYEFVPNGTVADHLHGDRANLCLLTWPIRMNIAIETASALAYLHASDIIHRDVKTNNILLDNNFCVKVADFGLSRLFPTDVTHVSTAPQGTPGYLDPEYHQCYQLTDKSDVYSFGVVLIELISSMPAVDISRQKHEINLANLAMNRIQKRAVDELIDSCLRYHLDEEAERMATAVAELAFLCLQQNKEMRPTMDMVLKELERIKDTECKPENLKEVDDDDHEMLDSMQQPPPCCNEAASLKNMKLPLSPISVSEKWVSNSTTPNVSN